MVKEKSYSFDTATILRQHSEDEAAGDWDRVMSTKVVTHKSVQFMVVTRRGVAGVFAAGHVTGEIRLAIVHAPILYQHSEDETATNWETLSSEEDATHKAAQSTVATHSGPTGLLAATHVTGGAVAAFVLVPVPLLQTVEETVPRLDKLYSPRNATHTNAQFAKIFRMMNIASSGQSSAPAIRCFS